MAERTLAHGQEIDKGILVANVNDAGRDRDEKRRGQFFAFIIVLIALGVAAYALSIDHAVAASVIGSFGLGGIVATLVTGRRSGGKKEPKDDESESEAEAG